MSSLVASALGASGINPLAKLKQTFVKQPKESVFELYFSKFKKQIEYYYMKVQSKCASLPAIASALRLASFILCVVVLFLGGFSFIVFFVPIDFLKSPAYLNIPVGIYCIIFAIAFPFFQYPFPKTQIQIPIINLFHINYAVKGIIFIIAALPLWITLISVIGAVFMVPLGFLYIFAWFKGEVPPFKDEVQSDFDWKQIVQWRKGNTEDDLNKQTSNMSKRLLDHESDEEF